MIVRLKFDTPEGQKIVEKLSENVPTVQRKKEIAETYRQRRGWTLISCDAVTTGAETTGGAKKKSGGK